MTSKTCGAFSNVFAIGCIVIICVARLMSILVWSDDMKQDPDAYVALAEGWAASGTFGRIDMRQDGTEKVTPTAYRPPLYPWMLSWLTRHDFTKVGPTKPLGESRLSLPAVAILHWLLGVGTCLMSIQIASIGLAQMSSPSSKNDRAQRYRPAYLVGVLIALDPILLRQSALPMTETVATFLATAICAWWCQSSGQNYYNDIFGGGLMGLAVLCRPTFAVWALLFLLVMLIAPNRREVGVSLRRIALIATGLVVVLTPWIVRNYIIFGKPIWATTHGGYTLLLANNPILFDHYRCGGVSRQWDESRFHQLWAARIGHDLNDPKYWLGLSEIDSKLPPTSDQQIVGELVDDKIASQAAWAAIQHQPLIFLKAIPIRIGWLWALWPSGGKASYAHQMVVAVWYILAFGATIVSLLMCVANNRARLGLLSRIMLPGLLLIIAITIVHAFYWSNMRMRSVAMPTVYVMLVCCGYFALSNWRNPQLYISESHE